MGRANHVVAVSRRLRRDAAILCTVADITMDPAMDPVPESKQEDIDLANGCHDPMPATVGIHRHHVAAVRDRDGGLQSLSLERLPAAGRDPCI